MNGTQGWARRHSSLIGLSLGIAISVVAMWLALRNVSRSEVVDAMGDADAFGDSGRA